MAAPPAPAVSRARAASTLGVVLLCAAVAAVVLGPALGAGYALHADQVFVPEQDLLPWMLGVGAGLPRAVPQDAVVAVLSGPVPGWLLEKAALASALVLLGVGAGRLVRSRGRGAAMVTGVVAVWSAYVAERLLLGHWSLLLAVAAVPWALAAARDAGGGRRAAGARWLLWVGLASLTPSGGLLVLVTSGPTLLRPGPSRRRRVGVLALGLGLQLPWLVPALQHPGEGVAAGGAEVFSARAEGPWGVLLTVATGGGAWNADAVPASRGTWWALLVGLVILAVAALGARDAGRVLGRSVLLPLSVLAVLGIGWCVLGAAGVTSPLAEWVVGSLPGGGLLRDAQKWLAPWALLVALCAGLGAARLAERVSRPDRAAGAAVLVAVGLLPVAAMPDLAWGASGRLVATEYPVDLERVRAALQSAPPGDVVSLPWQAFRAFPWNDGGRMSLDPMPRALPRTVLVADSLAVRHSGEVVVVAGDDPRARRVDEALAAGEALGPVLAGLGVGYAVVATDVPGAADDLPAGSTAVVTGSEFSLYRLGLAPAQPPGREVAGPAAALAVAGAVLVGAAAAATLPEIAVRSRRRRRAPREATRW